MIMVLHELHFKKETWDKNCISKTKCEKCMVSKQEKKRRKKMHEMVFNVWLNKPIVTHDNRHYKKKI